MVTPPAAGAFWAVPVPPAGGWTPAAFKDAVERAVDRGYTGVRVDLPWPRAQPEGPEHFTMAPVEGMVAYLRARKLRVALGVDHSVPPPWLDADGFAMRDEGGRIIATGARHPLLSFNAREVRDRVAALFRACAERFGGAVAYLEQLGPHLCGPAGRAPLDFSSWSAKGYRAWLRGRYVDIRTLNAAWEASFADWEQVEPGEGGRKSRQADFHAFRYATMASWTDSLRKAVRGGHPAGKFAFRSRGGRIQSDPASLALDLGRFVRAADVYFMEDATDPFILAMIRSAAEMWGRSWGIETSGAGALRIPPDAAASADPAMQAAAAKDLADWARRIHEQGGCVSVAGPVVTDAGQAVEAELGRLAQSPPASPRNNRKAVYVSAAEVQFWDGTDWEAARNDWLAATDGGKKHSLDVISDGMFTGEPGVLDRFTAGIEIPFARIIAKDARTALVQAAKNGVRLAIRRPQLTGTLDEHGQPTPPLAG